MTAITYDFQVVDSSGAGEANIPFPGTGAIASPGLVSLVTHDAAKTAIDPSFVTFVEYGQGYYGLVYDPDAANHGEAFAIVDAGGAVSGANRYIGIPLTADSSRLLRAISTAGLLAGLDTHALDVVEWPAVDLASLAEADQYVVRGLQLLKYLFTRSGRDANGNLIIKNGQPTPAVVGTLEIDDADGLVSIAPI
jgi:hypothetical protein